MWHTQYSRGTLVAQNAKDTYTLHMAKFGTPPEILAKTPEEILYWSLGDVEPFEHKINMTNHWNGHLVLSPTYGNGRVWMAGDAVHQVIPTGGYGMNSGIGDAWDLAWKLGAMVKGWGGEHLLKTVLEERKPVMERNIGASAQHAGVRVAIAGGGSSRAKASESRFFGGRLNRDSAYFSHSLALPFLAMDILGDNLLKSHSERGRKARSKLSAILYGLTNLENECTGLEVGYRYESGIVLQDDEHSEGGRRGRKGRKPEFDMKRYM